MSTPKRERCKRISFNAYNKEDAKYITTYMLENQPPHPDEVILRQRLNKIFHERAAYLPPRYQTALLMYFGLNKEERSYTYQEIGDHYGVCRERVRQLVQKSLRTLRHPSHNQHFRGFLEE